MSDNKQKISVKKSKAPNPFINGLIKENPTFVLMLGMCPTLAVTSSVMNGLGMGLSTTVVLVMSNLIISLLRNVIPDKVRVPSFIVIVASFVTMVEFILEAYIQALYESLGIYIALIVVNCIILGRAEAYASKNGPVKSILDGFGMGFGFTLGLVSISIFRELFGSGTILGIQIMPSSYEPISIFVLAPGAFFVLSMLTALQNKLKLKSATNGLVPKSDLACGSGCAGCTGTSCVSNREKIDRAKNQDNK